MRNDWRSRGSQGSLTPRVDHILIIVSKPDVHDISQAESRVGRWRSGECLLVGAIIRMAGGWASGGHFAYVDYADLLDLFRALKCT
jgi:hypothetical protein